MSDHWEVYLSESKTLVRVDMGIAEEAPIHGASILLEVNMKPKGLFSKKLDHELLGQVEDEIGSQLTESDYVVGVITYADSKSFYYYTKHEDLIFNKLNQLLSKYRNLKCKISTKDDPDWEFYSETLYPNLFEKQERMNMQVIEQLESHHDDLQQSREVAHWIYFPESENREDLKRHLDGSIYTIVQEEIVEESSSPYLLVISQISSVDYATINKITRELLEKALEAGGTYDGWECPVIASK